MKDEKNARWTLKEIAIEYQKENPNWQWDKCINKADIIYKELNRLNNQTWKNNKLYFKHNIPFSDFEDRDDEFGKQFYDWTSE